MAGRTVLTYHPLYNGRGFTRAALLGTLSRRLEPLRRPGSVQDPGAGPATPCGLEDLFPVHTAAYVEYVRRRDAQGSGYLDQRDTAAWTGVFERTLVAVGGTLEAVALVGSGAAAHVFNPGGGLHHAHRDPCRLLHLQRCGFGGASTAGGLRPGSRRCRRRGRTSRRRDAGAALRPAGAEALLHQYDGRFFPARVAWTRSVGGTATATRSTSACPATSETPGTCRRSRPSSPAPCAPTVRRSSCSTSGRRPLRRPAGTPVAQHGHLPHGGDDDDLAHELCAGRLIVFGSGGYDRSTLPGAGRRCWPRSPAISPLTSQDSGYRSPMPGDDGQQSGASDAGRERSDFLWPGRFAVLEDRAPFRRRRPWRGAGQRARATSRVPRSSSRDGVPLPRRGARTGALAGAWIHSMFQRETADVASMRNLCSDL